MDVGSATLLGWVFHGRLGPYMTGLHGAFGVGAFLSPTSTPHDAALHAPLRGLPGAAG